MLPEVGFVDTQQTFGSSLYNRKTFLSFYNPYAAMPSLHFGWALLVGIVSYSLRRRTFKILGILYPCLMALVIVTTGHHYFLDILGGGIAVGVAYAIVKATLLSIKQPSSSPAGIRGDIPYREKRTDRRPKRTTNRQVHRRWSKEERDLAQRQRLRSTILAALANWRPPV
jgi:membrane-associated phospholipid phosphatase